MSFELSTAALKTDHNDQRDDQPDGEVEERVECSGEESETRTMMTVADTTNNSPRATKQPRSR